MADAGEDPGTVSESEKVFPDPETLTPNEVNFAKALQLSMYFYDANKCGERSGRLEWRNDCHMEDAQIPLIPLTEKQRGTNLSQEFIDENRA
ncbi:MAG: glycoside hydrolase family 9 protein, partial [Oscillospiraceae bacterium]|nr:glycoside hydrolase family 9 protein [Oscillospiraceae bacterium]